MFVVVRQLFQIGISKRKSSGKKYVVHAFPIGKDISYCGKASSESARIFEKSQMIGHSLAEIRICGLCKRSLAKRSLEIVKSE